MKILRWFDAFGMIGVISFFTHIILGDMLHTGYNPIHQSISELTADGAPYFHLLRVFVVVYEICFLIFLLGMIREAFDKHHALVKIGFVLLLATAMFSIVGFNTFPMTVVFVISIKNVMHTIITITLLILSILTILLIAVGYLTKEKLIALGWFAFCCAVVPAFFNIYMWYAALHGGEYFGLIERLTIYPFHIFTVILSWRYFRLSKTINR